MKRRLVRSHRGKLTRTSRPLETFTDVPSQILKKHQMDNLTLASSALLSLPPIERECSSITMPGDPSLLPLAKKEILKFKKRMARILEGGSCSEVYTMAVQLFPLTKSLEIN